MQNAILSVIMKPAYRILRSPISIVLGKLSHKRRIQLFLMLLLMFMSGLSELLSLAAVIPFLGAISNPEQLLSNRYFSDFTGAVGVTEPSQLIVLVCVIFMIAVALTASVRIVNLRLNGLMAALIGSDIAIDCYRRSISQTYEDQICRNNNELMVTLIDNVNLTVVAITCVLQMATGIVVSTFLLLGLFYFEPQISIFCLMLFGSSYVYTARKSRSELELNSKKIVLSSERQLECIRDSIAGIRDLIISSARDLYISDYSSEDLPKRKLQAINQYIGIAPRYKFEAIGLLAIALFSMFISLKARSGSELIPLLGALALCSQRLLPALQQIFNSWSTIKSFDSAIMSVVRLLDQPIILTADKSRPVNDFTSIAMEGVSFSYKNMEAKVLDKVCLTILKGECVGIVGESGSGKSTLIDLLMGLLEPTEGKILIDEKGLCDPSDPLLIERWRSTISHVPQTIFLSGASLAENIALGSSTKDIDMERVRLAAESACISGFIESLKDKFLTKVGHCGVLLSGGQRQRIGIARALYNQSSLLVLDEATSALDPHTESKVMQAIRNLPYGPTIVMISHRLESIRKCDKVISIRGGIVTLSNASEYC